MSEYEDINDNTDITKSKSKEPVPSGNTNAELVGFKPSAESQMQMIEKEDAVRNDLPSLEKRGQALAPKKNRGEDQTSEVEQNAESLEHAEKDKYSSRLDDALAKLEELDEKLGTEPEKPLATDSAESKAPRVEEEISKVEKQVTEEQEDAKKAEKGAKDAESREKDVAGLKAELNKLNLDGASKSDESNIVNGDDKSISESEASSTVASPKRVRIGLFILSLSIDVPTSIVIMSRCLIFDETDQVENCK